MTDTISRLECPPWCATEDPGHAAEIAADLAERPCHGWLDHHAELGRVVPEAGNVAVGIVASHTYDDHATDALHVYLHDAGMPGDLRGAVRLPPMMARGLAALLVAAAEQAERLGV